MSPMKGMKGNEMKFRIFAMLFLVHVFFVNAYADNSLYLHFQCSSGQNCMDLAYANGRIESVVATPAMVLTKADVAAASVQSHPNAPPSLNMELGKDASQKLEKITRESVGKKLMVVFDNKILIAPTINEAISGGQIMISSRNGEQVPFWEKAPWLQDAIHASYQKSRSSVMVYVLVALAASIAAFLFILLPRMRRAHQPEQQN